MIVNTSQVGADNIRPYRFYQHFREFYNPPVYLPLREIAKERTANRYALLFVMNRN